MILPFGYVTSLPAARNASTCDAASGVRIIWRKSSPIVSMEPPETTRHDGVRSAVACHELHGLGDLAQMLRTVGIKAAPHGERGDHAVGALYQQYRCDLRAHLDG